MEREPAEKKTYEELKRDLEDLVQKYNSVVQDREKVIASIQLVSVRAITGMVSDLQSIARQAPRYDAIESQ